MSLKHLFSTAIIMFVIALSCSSEENKRKHNIGGTEGAGGVLVDSGLGGFGGITLPDAGLAGASGAGGLDGNCGSNLIGRIRDFREDHPDFEYETGNDRGIVQNTIGVDGKPRYASDTTTPTTNGKEYFDQWYRDVPGVNMGQDFRLNFVRQLNGIYTYEDNSFFPIDNQLFGNEGNEHNYHFTYEFHTTFRYNGGEIFTFTGDDDVFVFIHGRLVVDLGGVHTAQTATVDLDAEASRLGLVRGEIYKLDFFFAERHLVESNFRIDTNLVFIDCSPDPE